MALRQIHDLVMATFQGKRYSQVSGDGLANTATATITVSLGFLHLCVGVCSFALAWATAVPNTVTASMLPWAELLKQDIDQQEYWAAGWLPPCVVSLHLSGELPP